MSRFIPAVLLIFPPLVHAQLAPAQPPERASSTLATVLASRSPNQPAALGIAVAIRPNGVLLTPYHLVKDARAVQVRLNTGETYDHVQMLGVDARRDVAAIKITGTSLVTTSGGASEISPGDRLILAALTDALAWTSSEATFSGLVDAAQVPGAGTGYRLIRFTRPNPALTGSSGSALFDSHANLLGLVSGHYTADATAGLAIPIDNVGGLGDEPVSKTFSSGAALRPPKTALAKSTPGTKPSVESASPPLPPDTSLSQSKDRSFILRNFKTLYVDADDAKAFGSDDVKKALLNNSMFASLNLEIVDDRSAADAVLEVRRSLGAEYPFEVKSRNNVLLLRGSGVSFFGAAGARDVAQYFVQLTKPFRPVPKVSRK